MFGTDQLISIGAEDPEYYAELLSKIPRPTNRRLPCPDFPCIHNVDFALSRPLQTLLDAVADISLCQRGNVSATMASLKDNAGILETKLYIVFNHENDESAPRCHQHLQNIFNMLRQVPYRPPATGDLPKLFPNELEDNYIEICKAIHSHSFDIFHHRVTKRNHKLSEIQGYIEQDRTNFSDQGRGTLLTFLVHVGLITELTTKALTKKQLPDAFFKMLLRIYSYWTHHGLLPEDSSRSADNSFTLLDRADTWLAKNHGIGFKLRRWALKMMSFIISANRLFALTQSRRHHRIIHGNFSVQVLSSATTTPYRCHLSSETIQVALNAAVAETRHPPHDLDNKRESFIAEVLGELKEPIDADHWTPTVHAELAMIIAMVKGEIKDVLPYVGVSKLSCTMCNHYIGAFNEVWEQNIVTKGPHGKAYPGWSWPTFPDRDKELRRAFFGRVRRQLLSDFEAYAERQLSDSSVGSGELRFEFVTDDEIIELIAAGL